MDRREVLAAMAAAGLGLAVGPRELQATMARAQAAKAAGAFAPAFFTPHELRTATLLADYVIPRDARSGSASDAAVPEFMDFMCATYDNIAEQTRGGLAWLDAEMRRRHGRPFADAADRQRRALLDDIAWPARARPGLGHGVAFFSHFRDLTASGFFTSRMGIDDLGYQGNVPRHEWTGCPAEAVERLERGGGR